MRLADRSSGSASPRFSRHSLSRAASSFPMMVRASEPPINCRRSFWESLQVSGFTDFLHGSECLMILAVILIDSFDPKRIIGAE